MPPLPSAHCCWLPGWPGVMPPLLLGWPPIRPSRYHCTPNWNTPVSCTSRMRVSICTCSGTVSSRLIALSISAHWEGRARTSSWLLASTEEILIEPSEELYCWSFAALVALARPLPLPKPPLEPVPLFRPPLPLPNPLPLLPNWPPLSIPAPLSLPPLKAPWPPAMPPLLPKLPAVLPIEVPLALSALPSVPELRPGPTSPPLLPLGEALV